MYLDATVQRIEWKTLKASTNGPDFNRENRLRHGTDDLVTQIARLEIGPLNPEWCELLMGFPVGWSSIDGPPDQTKISQMTNHDELSLE
jgi:hypothetical protein